MSLKKNLLIFLFFAIIFLFPKVHAQNILVIKKTGTFKLDKYIGILKDKEHKLNIREIAAPAMQSKFVYYRKESLNLGFSSSVFWLKLKVIDSLGTENKWMLINNYPPLEDIQCFIKNEDGSYTEIRSGMIEPASKRVIKVNNFVTELPIKKYKLNTFYIRIISGSPILLSFSLLTNAEYINSNIETFFFYGVLFGILLLIIIYNSFLYFSIQDSSYLFYVLYVASYTLYIFGNEGFYSYFVGSIFPRDYYIIQMIGITCLGLFWLLLTRDFLSTKIYFRAGYKALNVLSFFAAGIILISFFLPLETGIDIFSISDPIFFAVGIIAAIVTLKRGYKLSWFYLLALTGTAAGFCILALRNEKMLPLNFWTDNAVNFGILWETIILSYSLGYRMGDLEKRVKERTSELTHRTEELKNLSTYLQNVREEERKYIASEIHDEFGGALSALKMDMFSLRDKIQICDDTAVKYNSMISLVDDTIKKVQKISTELRPEILDDLGLVEAIEWYAEEFQKRTGINCSMKIEMPEVELNTELTISLFRIFQETLTNIMRHSGAKETCIKLYLSDGMLSLSVEDNGRGINEEEVNSTKSLGLIGMRERIKKMNGSFAISKKDSGGTVVNVRIPVV